MTPENFAYWLQGFVELSGSTPTEEQWEVIKQHLQLIFVKVTNGQVTEGRNIEDFKIPTIGHGIDTTHQYFSC